MHAAASRSSPCRLVRNSASVQAYASSGSSRLTEAAMLGVALTSGGFLKSTGGAALEREPGVPSSPEPEEQAVSPRAAHTSAAPSRRAVVLRGMGSSAS
jgi:hypothetical protein